MSLVLLAALLVEILSPLPTPYPQVVPGNGRWETFKMATKSLFTSKRGFFSYYNNDQRRFIKAEVHTKSEPLLFGTLPPPGVTFGTFQGEGGADTCLRQVFAPLPGSDPHGESSLARLPPRCLLVNTVPRRERGPVTARRDPRACAVGNHAVKLQGFTG